MFFFSFLFVIENVYSYITSYTVYDLLVCRRKESELEAFEIHLQYVTEGC